MRGLAAVVVATLCALSPAQAEQRFVLPPLEYDHPYDGELVTVTAESTDEVRVLCPTVPFKSGWPLACSRRASTNRCVVVLAREDIIVAYGWTLDIILPSAPGSLCGSMGRADRRSGASTTTRHRTVLSQAAPATGPEGRLCPNCISQCAAAYRNAMSGGIQPPGN
jgi:hypothetical protein